MKTHTQYNPTTDISVLLIGPPGSGKTTAAYCFPDPYFISTDHKLQNAIKTHGPKTFYYDFLDVDDAGKPVNPADRFDRLFTLLKDNGPKKEVGTIVIDNLTDISDLLQLHLLSRNTSNPRPTVAGMQVMNQADWGPFKILMQRFLVGLRMFNKPVVVCAHEAVDSDEMTGTKIYRPLIPGQLRDILSSYFSNVWRCEAKPVPVDKDNPLGVKYYVRTVPTARMMLINSLGLPAEFSVSAESLSKVFSPTSVEAKKG